MNQEQETNIHGILEKNGKQGMKTQRQNKV